MDKEQKWLQKRLGMITASELGNITSASGKIIDSNISYIRRKRFERARGYALPVSSHAMDVGTQTEPMIFEWLKANCLDGEDPESLVYARDLPEIPFWVSPDCPLGASPDAYTKDERVVFEFKTLVGNETTEFFTDKYTSFEEKKTRVWKDHGDQLLGQWLSKPKVKMIVVIKYAPQLDDVLADMDSPLAEWRGQRFLFERKNFEASLDEMRQRVILFDKMIDAPINPSEFKKGEWYVDDNGQLLKK